jgi:hypothetical protein
VTHLIFWLLWLMLTVFRISFFSFKFPWEII